MIEPRQEIIKVKTTLYRVGKRKGGDGLWYDQNGDYTGKIHNLTEGNAGNLPMGKHPIFRSDGLHWVSVTDSISNLGFWFSEQDIIELVQQDYEVLKIEASEYRRFHFETYSHEVYSAEHAISIETLDPSVLYPSLKV